MNRNSLDYWFPILQAAGVPVPKTEIVRLPSELRKPMFSVLDGKDPGSAVEPFFAELGNACDRIGYPAFLRTGQFSGKHDWKRTCFLQRRDDLAAHVYALIELSEVVDFLGLPWDVWCVREMLPTEPIATLPAYGGFPLVPELRCFVRDGEISCIHPYWPPSAVKSGFVHREVPFNIDAIIAQCQDIDVSPYLVLARQVAQAFKGHGAWSVDILPTKRGLFVTDMAVASDSYHWPGCPALTSMAATR
jgi:hypothetical protein